MNRLEIELAGERTTFEPSEEIDLIVSWELEEAPERLELRLVWNTSGKGTTDLEIVQTVPFELPSPFDSRQTRMTLPGSPYSFSGKLITLQWGLELIAFPSEESTRREIVIAPAGTEVRLKSTKPTEPLI